MVKSPNAPNASWCLPASLPLLGGGSWRRGTLQQQGSPSKWDNNTDHAGSAGIGIIHAYVAYMASVVRVGAVGMYCTVLYILYCPVHTVLPVTSST
ncbi:hypothetical protein GQ53DRAFT_380334 [Thozetella sp. PMI_491]|nr:hypothetical protein GQ53DRAFT_380334 [Thozetella sp. PMI_491]